MNAKRRPKFSPIVVRFVLRPDESGTLDSFNVRVKVLGRIVFDRNHPPFLCRHTTRLVGVYVYPRKAKVLTWPIKDERTT